MNKAAIKKIAIFLFTSITSAYFIGDRLIYFSPGGKLERSSSYLIYPVLVMQHSVVAPIKNYFNRRRSVEELSAALAKAQQERDCAVAQNIELNALIDYSQNVAELLDFKQKYLTENAFIAQVIAKNFSEQGHYFLLDAGERKGVHVDMVAVLNNCLLGKVVEVYPLYSKLMLITDKKCKVAAHCVKTKSAGIYEGTNDLQAGRLNHISHLAQVSDEDLVLSSGEGLIFPKGFGLGKIRSYQSQGLFYNITLEPLVDLRSIQYCALLERDGSSLVLENL